MRRGFWFMVAMAFLSMSLVSLPASATVVVGGISFDDNAFVDEVLAYGGSWSVVGSPSLEAALVGSDTDSYVWSTSSSAYADLAFTDNLAKNGSGARPGRI